MPFTDSRRLTGPNVYFDSTAAVLEALAVEISPAQLSAWREQVEAMTAQLQWPAPEFHVRVHAKGATLAFTAPLDQLYCATEINEWAWSSASATVEAYAPGTPWLGDSAYAFRFFQHMAQAEAEPQLCKLIAEAEHLGWQVLLDEDVFSIGFGKQARCWPRNALPNTAVLFEAAPRPLPVALVTGSNGKTTSVRLLAAMARSAGFASGHNCTDGLFFNGELLEADDYSGPAGARATLRHAGVQAAILETARGGLLRRGLATRHADVALVTNISEDHFGEYGVFTLDDLAVVKLTVAKGIKPEGHLVLNAADRMLVKHGSVLAQKTDWFALDWNNAFMQMQLSGGSAVCGFDQGRLCLYADGMVHDLGSVDNMPIAFKGIAQYNMENIAGAALSAYRLGFGLEAIQATLQNFGRRHIDNPGRLQNWQFGDVQVFMDYAHNPEGMHGFLRIADAMRGSGRLAVLLGQAGNRENDDIVKLAESVAHYRPDKVVLKDMQGYERGRQPGEVPALLESALLQNGVAGEAVEIELNELQAVRKILGWATPGDILALPVHGLAEREAVQALLEAMREEQWRAGKPLPAELAEAKTTDSGA
jgi:cyanophycin synthetase